MERVDLGLLMGGYGMGVCAKFTAMHLGCRGGLGRPFLFGAAVLGSRCCWLVSKAKQGDAWISSVLQRSWTECLGSWPEPTRIGKAQLRKEEFAAPPCYWEKEDLENGKRKKKKYSGIFVGGRLMYVIRKTRQHPHSMQIRMCNVFWYHVWKHFMVTWGLHIKKKKKTVKIYIAGEVSVHLACSCNKYWFMWLLPCWWSLRHGKLPFVQ